MSNGTELAATPALLQKGAEDRYYFIELMAFWEGRVNATSMQVEFQLSRQQCSADINAYKTAHPLNLRYCAKAKAHTPTDQFTPVFISRSVDEYLFFTQLGLRRAPHLTASSQSLNLPKRFAHPNVIRAVVAAIKNRQRIEVDYVSLSNPNRDGRIIVPHAFVNTGLRWHLRAWCEKSSAYRDFVLSRFRGTAELLGPSTQGGEQDIGWNTQITLIIEPDPRLTAAQQRVLEEDYQMQNGQLRITTRGCLVNYLLHELQISTKTLDATPEAQQLVLVNLGDIKPWLFG